MMEIERLSKPNVTEDLAIDLVRNLYGLRVTDIKRMVSFDDQNFHIQVSEEYENANIMRISPNGYTLKITNTLKSSAEGNFDMMHFVMDYLDKKELVVPKPVQNLHGKTWKLEKVPLLNEEENSSEPKLCGIHLLTFIPGTPVSTVEYTGDILFQWGRLLAMFHDATQDMDCPPLHKKTVLWDLDHVPEIRKYIGVLEDQKKKLICSVLDKYPSEITENIKNLPKGFIHGDFNENNVLVKCSSESGESSYYVNGVLDFEDIHYGTYIWDIGVFLAYTLLENHPIDPLERTGYALAGYLSLRSLNDLELSVLKTCVESRLCQSLVLCAYSYSKDPTNSYLLLSAKTGWARLEQITAISKEDLQKKWNEIRNYRNTEKVSKEDVH